MKRKEESSIGQKPGSKEARSGVFRGWKESGVVSEWVRGGSTHLHGGNGSGPGSAPAACPTGPAAGLCLVGSPRHEADSHSGKITLAALGSSGL